MGFIQQFFDFICSAPAVVGLSSSSGSLSTHGDNNLSVFKPTIAMKQRDVDFNHIQNAIDAQFGARFRLVNFTRENDTIYAQLEHTKKGYTLVVYSCASLDQSWQILYSTAGEFSPAVK